MNTTQDAVSMSENLQGKELKKGRRTMWALLLVTGLPFLAALYLFYNPQVLDGFGTKNRGQLVQPTVVLPSVKMQTLDGGTYDSASMQGNWSLLLLAGSSCNDNCMQNLFHLRQTRLAMGENRYRVQRLMLLTDEGNTSGLAKKLESFQGTHVLVGPAEARDSLIRSLAVNGEAAEGRIYTIDPQGRLILSYDSNPPWEDVLKDLKYLIRVVQL